MLQSMVGPTTLSQLTTDEFGQLVDSDLFPQGLCPSCQRYQPVAVWGSEGWHWSARCSVCDSDVPAQFVTFITSHQMHLMLSEKNHAEMHVGSLKPN